MIQDNSKPLPPISKKTASENELPGLKDVKHYEKVMYKPELYDETKHRLRPISAPMSKRTIKNRDLISKTKENISHSNLVEKEVEGLNPIEAFKQKLLYNTLNTERKRNPKLSKPIQIEIKKQYLNYKYKNYDPMAEEVNFRKGLHSDLEDKKSQKKLKFKSEILYNQDAQYMLNFIKNEIESDNLLNYIEKKKNESKKLNIKEVYMYKSDVDKIRNRNNRDSVSYNGNFKVSGSEYVGADEQVYEFCHKRNYISLPKRYIQYYKNLEELDEKDNNKVENDNNKEKNKIEENKSISSNKDLKKSNETRSKSEINIKNNDPDAKFQKKSINGEFSPIKTYYGSNSGYNALSRPALNSSLVKRHNVHRNNEHYNIEQIVLRRLRYILNFNKIDKDHIYLIDCLKESNIPNDYIQLSFQNNFESVDELRNELLGQMLKDKEGEGNDKNNATNENKNDEIVNDNVFHEKNKCKSNNNTYSDESINIKSNEKSYCNISKNFRLSDSNLKYKKINGEEPKSSRKIRILPKRIEPTTPRELLYIIDNYNNINKKTKNDYKRYSIFDKNTPKISSSMNTNKSIHEKLDNNLKSNSKDNNPELSCQEILKALRE